MEQLEKETFAEMFEESSRMNPIHNGQIVEGTILEVTGDTAVLDIGSYLDGILTQDQLLQEGETMDNYPVGTKLTVVIKKVDTKNSQVMAVITLEDMAGSIEVLVFPKSYEKYRGLLQEDAKVFITGRASIGDDPAGKLVCDRVVSFDAVPREVWIQFADMESYRAAEEDLTRLLGQSAGKDQVVIYLKKERAKKVLPAQYAVRSADEGFLRELEEAFGKDNVRTCARKMNLLRKYG